MPIIKLDHKSIAEKEAETLEREMARYVEQHDASSLSLADRRMIEFENLLIGELPLENSPMEQGFPEKTSDGHRSIPDILHAKRVKP